MSDGQQLDESRRRIYDALTEAGLLSEREKQELIEERAVELEEDDGGFETLGSDDDR